MRVFLSLLFVMQALSAGGSDAALWRYVHPRSKALLGIDWASVRQSAVGAWIQRRWMGDLTIPGAEFLKDVDEVLISSPGTAGADDEPPLLIAIHGHFELDNVRKVLVQQGATRQVFDGITLYRQKGKSNGEPAFALISPQIILVADIQSLFSTIERSRIVAVDEHAALVGRGQTLAAHYDCWAVMGEGSTLKNFLFSSLMGKTLSSESLGFEAGISVHDGFAIDVTMSQRTERAARILMNDLKRMVAIAALDHDGSPEFGALLQKLRITADKTTVVMSLRMTNQEASASLPSPRQVPARAVAVNPPEKLVIRIEGLEEGPRELPFSK